MSRATTKARYRQRGRGKGSGNAAARGRAAQGTIIELADDDELREFHRGAFETEWQIDEDESDDLTATDGALEDSEFDPEAEYGSEIIDEPDSTAGNDDPVSDTAFAEPPDGRRHQLTPSVWIARFGSDLHVSVRPIDIDAPTRELLLVMAAEFIADRWKALLVSTDSPVNVARLPRLTQVDLIEWAVKERSTVLDKTQLARLLKQHVVHVHRIGPIPLASVFSGDARRRPRKVGKVPRSVLRESVARLHREGVVSSARLATAVATKFRVRVSADTIDRLLREAGISRRPRRRAR
jgi:hypothetical protein